MLDGQQTATIIIIIMIIEVYRVKDIAFQLLVIFRYHSKYDPWIFHFYIEGRLLPECELKSITFGL